MQLPSLSPTFVRRAALAAVIFYGLLVITGGAVRLSGSGLGCPDWPSCYAHHFTAQSSIHGQIEFSNRVISALATIVSIGVFASTLLRRPYRRDLVWLASGLIVGILCQIVLGGLVVLYKLNPYLVSAHFLLTFAILWVALVLYHRAGTTPARSHFVIGRDLLWLSRLLIVVLAALICLGTVVTGSGPHAGGRGAKRYPIAFRDIAEAHSTVAVFLIGMTLATLFSLHHAGVDRVVQRRAQLFLEVLFLQGTLGYVQYFLHDAAVVVEFHLAGATLAWVFAIRYYHSLHAHPEISRQHASPTDSRLSDETLSAPAPV